MNHRFLVPLIIVSGASLVFAQGDPTTESFLDKMLERRTFTPQEEAALNQDGNAAIDVRDLAIFLNGQPLSATFATAETVAFHSAGSVALTILFSKPVTGTIRLELGGSALEGADKDFTISYHDAGQKTFLVNNETSLSVPVVFPPDWEGIGGEKVISLTIGRDPAVIPLNGLYSTHVLRVRQFDAGEFVGILNFPDGAGLPALPVRVGLDSGGGGVCSFPQVGGLFGSEIPISWDLGEQGFPDFSVVVPITIPGESMGRPPGPEHDISASLAVQRVQPPYGEDLEAFLEGFPANDQPALYEATFTFHNLVGAGARFSPGSNPFAVVHQGRLVLQPVKYAAAP